MLSREKILERAQNGVRENKSLDFKASFDPESRADWCEIIKDIVAFANSGGGAIVLGLNDDLSNAGFDPAPVLALDSADVTNWLARYTGYQFGDFEILEIERDEIQFAAIIIFAVSTPMVFQKPGTYAVAGGRQKNAFSQGTVYFRHGSKSEPANMDDLNSWRDRELEKVRTAWLSGVRQVVEAPAGHSIQVVTTEGEDAGVIAARLVNDPNAIPMRPERAEVIWPYRRIELLRLVNEELPDGIEINGHDIISVKSQYQISQEQHPQFVFKSHRIASPQYSEEYVNWLVQQYQNNENFFIEARAFYRNN